MKEKFLKDELFDAYLTEYFIFDSLLDRGIDRKKLLSIVSKYMDFSKVNLDKLYLLLSDDDVTSIETINDFNRVNRILEYNRLYNPSFTIDDELKHVIMVKGAALDLLNKNKIEVSHSLESYQGLTNLSIKGLVIAMRVSGVMYFEGLYYNKCLNKGFNLLRKASRWADVNSNLALACYSKNLSDLDLAKHNLSKDDNAKVLNSSIRNTMYELVISDIYNKFAIDLGYLDKVSPEVKLLKRLFASNRIDEAKYEKNYSRLLFSSVISYKDKEKVLFSDYKGILSTVCDLPLQLKFDLNIDLSKTKVLFNKDSDFRKLNSELKKVALLESKSYKPLALVSTSHYILSEYSKYLNNLFEGSNVSVINTSELTGYDLDKNENNIFLRSLNDSKNNIVLINLTGKVETVVLREVVKFLSSVNRMSFNLSNLSLTIDLRCVLPIVLCDKENYHIIGEFVEGVELSNLSQDEVLDEALKIARLKQNEYLVKNVNLTAEFKDKVMAKSIDEVYKIIDVTIRNSYGEDEAVLDLSSLDKVKGASTTYGFGGVNS